MNWKKIFGYVLIATSILFIVVGLSGRFYKTPYCDHLIANYRQNPSGYEYEYVGEVKSPNGQCYNHFTALKFVSNAIVFTFGFYLLKSNKRGEE